MRVLLVALVPRITIALKPAAPGGDSTELVEVRNAGRSRTTFAPNIGTRPKTPPSTIAGQIQAGSCGDWMSSQKWQFLATIGNFSGVLDELPSCFRGPERKRASLLMATVLYRTIYTCRPDSRTRRGQVFTSLVSSRPWGSSDVSRRPVKKGLIVICALGGQNELSGYIAAVHEDRELSAGSRRAILD